MQAVDALDIIQCSARFLSIEPLLGSVEQKNHYLPLLFQGTLDWVIVGQQTPPSKKTEPKIEWMREILEAADKASIPVFLKNNLLTLFPYGFLKETEGKAMAIDFKLPQWAGFDGKLRQEFPDVQKIQAK